VPSHLKGMESKKRMKQASQFFLLLASILLLGCSSPSGKEAQGSASQQNTLQLETGRIALQKMIPPGRFWAQDAQPVNLESEVLKDNNGHGGKSGFWRATFASPSRLKSEAFTWSGMTDPNTPRGVDHGTQDSFSPLNRSTQPFELGFLKVDSDKAFEVAQQHGGKQLLAKDPSIGVKYSLNWDAQASQLKWRVMYGGNEVSARLAVVVSATTGDFLHKE
jgi:hypothetical protein